MDTLVLKVFSLTNVPPQEQTLFGVLPSGDPVHGASTGGQELSVSPGTQLALLTRDKLPGSDGACESHNSMCSGAFDAYE